MKYLLTFCLVGLVGCATTERNLYVTMGATTTAVELARQAYVNHENTCRCVTQSEHDKVQIYYTQYQAAAKLAQDAITAYKNSTVPDQAAIQIAPDLANKAAIDIISLIERLLPATDKTTLKTKLPRVKGVK